MIYVFPFGTHGNDGNMFNFHSYGCQKIQTKNPFIWILGLGFSLRHLNMNTYCVKDSQFYHLNGFI